MLDGRNNVKSGSAEIRLYAVLMPRVEMELAESLARRDVGNETAASLADRMKSAIANLPARRP